MSVTAIAVVTLQSLSGMAAPLVGFGAILTARGPAASPEHMPEHADHLPGSLGGGHRGAVDLPQCVGGVGVMESDDHVARYTFHAKQRPSPDYCFSSKAAISRNPRLRGLRL